MEEETLDVVEEEVIDEVVELGEVTGTEPVEMGEVTGTE